MKKEKIKLILKYIVGLILILIASALITLAIIPFLDNENMREGFIVWDENGVKNIDELYSSCNEGNFCCTEDFCSIGAKGSEKLLFGEVCECTKSYYGKGNNLNGTNVYWREYSEIGAICELYKCGDYLVSVVGY